MKLNQNQINFYNSNGYLIVGNLFTEIEINTLKEDAKMFDSLKSLPNVICEENGEIRSIFAPEKHSKAFKWLYKQDRIVRPSEQLVGNQLYLYQFKLNNKKSLGGDWWEWHQDFPYWHLDDGVKDPKMISVMLLFQETKSVQGPLIVIPGSHKVGIVDFEDKIILKSEKDNLKNSLSANLKYTIKKDLIKQFSENNELIICEGGIGTCIFFHPNLFHASNSNLSPYERNTAIVTYNDIDNIPEDNGYNRPNYLCSRSFDVILSETQDSII